MQITCRTEEKHEQTHTYIYACMCKIKNKNLGLMIERAAEVTFLTI